MARYYFDHRDGEDFIQDDEGVELDSLEVAIDEAALTLAEYGKEVLPGSRRRVLTIEVRDENKKPLLQTSLTFEVRILASQGPVAA